MRNAERHRVAKELKNQNNNKSKKNRIFAKSKTHFYKNGQLNNTPK